MANDNDFEEYGFLRSGGELARLIREFDWEHTPLGPLQAWPQSLKTSVSIMLNSRHPMWIGWGEQMTFLYNDAYIQVLSQAKHPQALGQPASEVWREIWDICGPLADKVFQQEEASFVDDVRLFMDRGSFVEETFYSFSYSPIRVESGHVGGLFCPSTEVTPKILSARRLRTLSELAAKALAEKSVPDACASAAQTLGRNSDDVPFALLYLVDESGQTARLEQAVHLSDPHMMPQQVELAGAGAIWPLARVLQEGGALVVDVDRRGQLPAGLADQRIAQAMALPVTETGKTQPSGVLIAGISPARLLDEQYLTFFELAARQIGNAIHNAKAIEEERRKAEMLAEIDAAKTAFFSNVSHEFRTPLTLMLGPIEDALNDAAQELAPAQRDRIELVRRNALRLQKLVNSLLDFSRLQAGRMHARYVPADLAALTADLAGSFRSAIEGAGLRFAVECAPLPEPVYVDPGMWEKIVLNLISNAFKFTFEGGIQVRLAAAEGKVALEVGDTGIGIAQDQLPRLFERFHRVEGARSRTYEGSGIGLSLVHDLVKLHGGTVTAHSVSGAGTTFRIELPLGLAHLPAERIGGPVQHQDQRDYAAAYVMEAQRWQAFEAPETAQEPAGAGPDLLTAAHVLVVDDNADMRDYVTRILAGRWRVTAVSNGQQALDAMTRFVPDVVVSDIMMPVLDGYGLLRAVRAQPQLRDLPFVLLSARAGEEARVDGMRAGADEYLVKPFSGRELMARLETLLLRSRMRALEAAQRQRMEQVFSQAPVAIAILRGPEHVFELANDFYARLVGRRPVVGKPIREALPELEGQGIYEILDQVFTSGEPYIGRSRRVDLQAPGATALREYFFDFVYQPMRDYAGQLEGIAVVVYDVTELTAARRSAEQANRAKDEFLAMLGHELRNPLAPILTALHLMRLRGIDVAEKERAMIERQAQHLVRLVDDLLDVSRVAQGKIELRKERIEAVVAVAKAVEMASPLLEERHQRLDVDVPEQGLLMDADPARLAQVIANLLNNAAKYTDRGGQIRVWARHQNGSVLISVQDSGIGIEPEVQPHVFDMFMQVRQALDRSKGGLGLGLAIVRSIVELHGGSVSVASGGKGQGSTFAVRIPALEPQPESPESLALASTVPRQRPDGFEILVVDDNMDAARALTELLALFGHRAEVEYDGPSALKRVESFQPQVALLDIGLPGMDGYELGALLRQRPGLEGLRLVAISGYGQSSDQARSAAAGFDLHLVKPIDIEELEKNLRTLLADSAGKKRASM